MPMERIASFDTSLNAAVCEFGANQALLCGTYQLAPQVEGSSEPPKEKLGSFLALDIHSESSTNEISVKKSLILPGILDIRPRADMVAVMISDGSVRFLHGNGNGDAAATSLYAEKQKVQVTSGLCLAGAWNFADADSNRNTDKLAVVDSTGGVTILQAKDGQFELLFSRNWHKYEVWSVCWDCSNENILYSGADDSHLNVNDLRTARTAVVVSGHESGVTSIVSDPTFESLLLTGSYDEKLRCWDKRSLAAPVATVELGGGVWRIKVNQHHSNMLACACMQGGCRIVKFEKQQFKIVKEFMLDRELVYGIDWSPKYRGLQSASTHFEIAACSFYDHVLDIYSGSIDECC